MHLPSARLVVFTPWVVVLAPFVDNANLIAWDRKQREGAALKSAAQQLWLMLQEECPRRALNGKCGSPAARAFS